MNLSRVSTAILQVVFVIMLTTSLSSSQITCRYPFTIESSFGCFFVPPDYDLSTGLPFVLARQQCEQAGGYLAVLDTPEKNELISNYSLEQEINVLPWIGLYNTNHVDAWVWDATGEPANYTNWIPGAPGNIEVLHCAVLDTLHNKWNTLNCEEMYATYVCEQLPDECSVECSKPFVTIGDGCYLFATDVNTVDWITAKEYCSQQGTGLAVLDNAVDDSNIGEYILNNNLDSYKFWIGLYHEQLQSEWYWNGIGESAISYTNWGEDYPIDNNTLNCVAVVANPDHGQYFWENRNCQDTNQMAPLCQIPKRCISTK